MNCSRCSSMAINTHLHGREPGVDLDLCDVCYWRKRSSDAAGPVELTAAEMREAAAKVCDSFACPCRDCANVKNAMRQFAAEIRALPLTRSGGK